MEKAVLLISPFAPHLAEELWQQLGHEVCVVETPWPSYDAALAQEEEYEIVIQVNGRVRGHIRIREELDKEELLKQALTDPRIASLVASQRIAKTVVVPKKLINIVLAA